MGTEASSTTKVAIINIYELTIEECVEVIIVHFTELEKVLASLGACFHLQVDDDIPKRSFEEHRHSFFWSSTRGQTTS